jgi:hypothetical protein
MKLCSEQPSGGWPGRHICRKAGGAVACWYRMVLVNVRDGSVANFVMGDGL